MKDFILLALLMLMALSITVAPPLLAIIAIVYVIIIATASRVDKEIDTTNKKLDNMLDNGTAQENSGEFFGNMGWGCWMFVIFMALFFTLLLAPAGLILIAE